MDSDSYKLTLTVNNTTRDLVVKFALSSGGKVNPNNIPILLQKLKVCLEGTSSSVAKNEILTKFIADVWTGPLPLFIMYVHQSVRQHDEVIVDVLYSLFYPSLSSSSIVKEHHSFWK